jgi:hypothetical protein
MISDIEPRNREETQGICSTWPCRSKPEKNNDLRSLNKGETIDALSSFLFFASKEKFDKASIWVFLSDPKIISRYSLNRYTIFNFK